LVCCFISAINNSRIHNKLHVIHSSAIDFRKGYVLDLNAFELYVTGDIKVELTNKTSKKSFFRFWFNTYFISEFEDLGISKKGVSKIVYTLQKWEIDDAHKDRENKFFPEDFQVQITFSNNINGAREKIEHDDTNFKVFFNDNDPQPFLQNGFNISTSSSNITLIENHRFEKLQSQLNNSKNNNYNISKENMLCSNSKAFTGISLNEDIGTSMTRQNISHNFLEESTDKAGEPVTSVFKIKCQNAVRIPKTVDHPIDGNQQSLICERNGLSQLQRSSSSTSSNFSNCSNRLGIFEGDWESGESTYL